ncbi:mycothiol synthase [Nocardia sp. alder85J]|uniref:mycothiol synthase n=1 Tax=Nocardia sp. alder85J TaxID=2862949 RepID=UPI001CD479A0|nr:mycothiol synthase [Nocardia sp. alder85J]MCX4093353.1 mycothiol synthase [Nocardia sp. alder85J]
MTGSGAAARPETTPGPHDWTDALTPEVAGRVREVFDRAAAADGVDPLSEQVTLSFTSPSSARHLVARRDEAVAGYANLVAAHGGHPAMAEVVVDPRQRGRGLGAALVAAALAAGGPDARVWAHGNLAPAKAVAGRLGLRVARELWQMRRSLATGELPELRIPDGIELRTYAGPGDDAELLRVNGAAFDWHPEQGGWTAADVTARRESSWFDPAGLFVAVDPARPDRMLGFHWTKVHPATDTERSVGEVYVVAVDPAAQGRGLGRLLTLAGLHYLRAREKGEVLLYTEADNIAAVHTYTRLGFEVAHVDAAYAAA